MTNRVLELKERFRDISPVVQELVSMIEDLEQQIQGECKNLEGAMKLYTSAQETHAEVLSKIRGVLDVTIADLVKLRETVK